MDPQVSTLEELLKLNREETRFWQQLVAQATFWFNSGIVAISAWLLEKTTTGRGYVLLLGALGIALLAGLYVLIARGAVTSLEMNWKDLHLIQIELRLHVIYDSDGQLALPRAGWAGPGPSAPTGPRPPPHPKIPGHLKAAWIKLAAIFTTCFAGIAIAALVWRFGAIRCGWPW